MKKKCGKQIFLILVLLLFLFGVAVAGYVVIRIQMEYTENRQVIDEIQEEFRIQAEDEPDARQDEPEIEETKPAWLKELEQIEVDFEGLLSINEDVRGWLYIPAADVDHPVVQSKDNEDYLYHTLYGDYLFAGTLFLDMRCAEENCQNYVIYGHNMTDGTMFAPLKQYLDPEFCENNTYFWYITPETAYRCDIIGSVMTERDEEYLQTSFVSAADYTEYVQWIKSNSVYAFDATATYGDTLMTLSTCNRTVYANGRHAIYAKMTDIRDLMEENANE